MKLGSVILRLISIISVLEAQHQDQGSLATAKESYIRVYNAQLGPSVVIVPSGYPDVGQNYSLACRVHGLSNSTIQWSRDGSNGVIQQDVTLEFFPLATDDAGEYQCTSTANSSFSATKTVVVNSKPNKKKPPPFPPPPLPPLLGVVL